MEFTLFRIRLLRQECQMMVLVSIQHQQESPIWGAVKKETLFSAHSLTVTQHSLWEQQGYDGLWVTRARHLSSWTALLFSGPVQSAMPALIFSGQMSYLWCFIFFASASARGKHSLKLWWKEKMCSSSQKEVDLYRQKSPLLVPDGYVFMQMRTPNPQFDWSKKHSPDWSVKMLMGI